MSKGWPATAMMLGDGGGDSGRPVTVEGIVVEIWRKRIENED